MGADFKSLAYKITQRRCCFLERSTASYALAGIPIGSSALPP